MTDTATRERVREQVRHAYEAYTMTKIHEPFLNVLTDAALQPPPEGWEAACNEFSMGRALFAAEPLMRARHVREAVEGLPTAFTDSREFVRVCGHVMPRAALLAALTGEGM